MDLKDTVLQALNELVKNGGEGSGDFNHAGNPPHVGGSEPVGSRHARGFKSKSERKEVKKEEKKEDKKVAETKTGLNTAETNYKEVLKKYNEAGKKRWEQNISQDEYYKAWEDYEKYKKELTKARREYAESIMTNFEKSDDISYEDKQNARRERYENLLAKAKQQSNQKHQSFRDKMSIIPAGQPIHGQKDARYREKAWDTLGQAVKLSDKAKYYEDKAKSVGKAGISADDKNAILKLAEKYKSGVDSAEKRRIIDRVISIHQNSKITETSKASESYEKLGFNLERNSDANRLQLKFNNIPDASVRSILKSNGFRWSPTNKAWQRQLGANSEYAFKRVVEKLSDRAENCIYKREYIDY